MCVLDVIGVVVQDLFSGGGQKKIGSRFVMVVPILCGILCQVKEFVSRVKKKLNVIPTENSTSIEAHLVHLRIAGIYSNGLHRFSSRSIMTDEGSVLVKFDSLISGYNHYLCPFHIYQLIVGVSYCLFLCE